MDYTTVVVANAGEPAHVYSSLCRVRYRRSSCEQNRDVWWSMMTFPNKPWLMRAIIAVQAETGKKLSQGISLSFVYWRSARLSDALGGVNDSLARN